MEKIKSLAMWVLTGFMGLSALVFFPSLASVLMLAFAVVAAPVKPWQEILAGYGFRGRMKGLALCVAFIGSVFLAPTNQTSRTAELPSAQPSSLETLPSRVTPTESPAPEHSAGLAAAPTSKPSPTPTPKPSPTPTPEPSPTPTPEPSPTPTPKPSPTPTPEPSPTPTPKPSPTPAPEPSPTPAPKPSPTPTPKPSPTPEPTPTPAPPQAANGSDTQGGTSTTGGTWGESSTTNEITGALSRTAYWTPNGKSYHFSTDCPSLSRSKTILQGTLQQALNAGKTDPCNHCAGGT